MDDLNPSIRNAVYAVIVRDDRVLLQRKSDQARGLRYCLPGGGQQPGESLVETLQRECREEIAASVEALEIAFVADFFKPKTASKPYIRHQVAVLFYGRIAESYIPRNGPKPDKSQVAVEWISMDSLVDLPLSPVYLREILPKLKAPRKAEYLGTFN